ncbi:MAG: DUF1232 domain-containing protein [Chitinophagales bacterium]|nr:DUF1232 domain-containing protein [Chitinophagales bacterium]MCZ2393589.1 DUF1232 domain-containing protein [Chitinophagales bacterium]
MFKIEIYIDKLIKEAERISNEHQLVSKLIDIAFEKIGQSAGQVLDFESQVSAIGRMLKAWYAREYTGLSKQAVISLVASLIYVVNPLDFIPDFIPVIGRLDDKLVLGYLIKKMNSEIQKFMAWEELQNENS